MTRGIEKRDGFDTAPLTSGANLDKPTQFAGRIHSKIKLATFSTVACQCSQRPATGPPIWNTSTRECTQTFSRQSILFANAAKRVDSFAVQRRRLRQRSQAKKLNVDRFEVVAERVDSLAQRMTSSPSSRASR